tara:strand:+ start:176 stop:328 length:153 start_codon:yes stop_codon:yes gene_type:complete
MFESFRLWLADRVFNLYMWLCPPAYNPFAYHETDADFNDIHKVDDDKIEW